MKKKKKLWVPGRTGAGGSRGGPSGMKEEPRVRLPYIFNSLVDDLNGYPRWSDEDL